MNVRSNALAERIEQGAEALATLAEGLTAAEWQPAVANDQRPVNGFYSPFVYQGA